MHGQSLEYFEQEEAGEGQGDKQQGIFNRPVGLQVLVDRVDKAHAKFAAVIGIAIVVVGAVIQHFGKIGGKETGLPVGNKTRVGDLPLDRQKLADKTWVWPLRT